MPLTGPVPMAAPDGGPSDRASAGRIARPRSVGTDGPADAAAAGSTAAAPRAPTTGRIFRERFMGCPFHWRMTNGQGPGVPGTRGRCPVSGPSVNRGAGG